MSDVPAKPTPLLPLIVVAAVLVADAAMYKRVFELMGTTGGIAFMVLGTLFVAWCVYTLERRA